MQPSSAPHDMKCINHLFQGLLNSKIIINKLLLHMQVWAAIAGHEDWA
jgi:hypothetical protein